VRSFELCITMVCIGPALWAHRARSHMSLFLATLLDTFVLVTCAVILYKDARLTSAHPGFMYLIFHMTVFTARMYSVMGGSPTLFTGWPGALPVSEQEIAWAGVLADVALISMTVALVLCSRSDRRRTARSFAAADVTGAVLSEKVILLVSAVAFPIGIVALLAFGAVPHAGKLSIDVGGWNTSSWTMVTQFWPGLVLLALIYFYGFRPILMFPMGIFLALMAIQGYDRFRVVLPVIFLFITWQTRKGFKWPRTWMIVSFACLAMISFPMKQLGTMVQQGEPLSDIVDVASDRFSNVLRGTEDDQKFMDMFATTLWLVDGSGRHFYGTMYWTLLVMPVPRQWWPDKPGLMWYATDLTSPVRPIAGLGMVVNMLGEAYANFGLTGIAAVPFIVGYGLGKFYFVAMRKSYFSVYRFMYVTLACCLILVFRDGLFSAVIFPVVNMMPLVVIAVLSYFSFRRNQTWGYASPSFMPDRERGVAQT